MAVFLSIAFLGQIFSIFSAFELRYRINAEHWPRGETDKNMKLYNTDSDVQHNWDVMQRDLRSDMFECVLSHFKNLSRSRNQATCLQTLYLWVVG